MKPLLLAFLTGLVSACGFQPIGAWPLMLVALAGLFWLIERAPSLRSALARGWAFGLGNFVLGLNWIATSFTYQANMPAWLGWIAVVLLSLYLAVYPAMAAGLAWKYGRSDRLALVLVLAAAWTVTEWLRATMFTGFAWNPVGVALVATPVAQLAKILGTYGLSAVAILISGILLLILSRRWLVGSALVVLLAAATGLAIMATSSRPSPAGLVRIVQPNIGQDEKWIAGSHVQHLLELAEYSRSTRKLLARLEGRPEPPMLLLWPEAAVTLPLQDERRDPYYQDRARQIRQFLGQLVGPNDLLLTGGVTMRSRDGVEPTSATNSIFAVDGNGEILARYDKAHLVPYGEYLPMRPLLSRLGLSRLAPGDVDFDAGPGPRTLDLPLAGEVGFQICYEIIFSGHVVDPANRPDFIFNPSNDAWFGAWGPPQHLAQARLRALEEGLPVLRATPTGISAVIDPDGRLLQSIPWRTAGVIETALPGPRGPTPFARFGNLLPILFALLLAGAAIAVRRKAR